MENILCERCKKRNAEHVHFKNYKTEQTPKGDHRLLAEQHPDWFENLCTKCHAIEHNIEPKQSELKRLIILRDRDIKRRNMLQNQIKGFSRIEYIVPQRYYDDLEKLNTDIKETEKQIIQTLKENNYPVLDRLLKVRGIKEITAAKLLAYIDINNSETSGQLRRYCGLDPSVKRKKGISQKQAKQSGNPYLKKELMGIVADNFIRQRTPYYRDVYDETKQQELKLMKQYGKGVQVNGNGKTTVNSLMHAHNRAKRKMIQKFMNHYYNNARQTEGLTVKEPFNNEGGTNYW